MTKLIILLIISYLLSQCHL